MVVQSVTYLCFIEEALEVAEKKRRRRRVGIREGQDQKEFELNFAKEHKEGIILRERKVLRIIEIFLKQ